MQPYSTMGRASVTFKLFLIQPADKVSYITLRTIYCHDIVTSLVTTRHSTVSALSHRACGQGFMVGVAEPYACGVCSGSVVLNNNLLFS